MSKTKSAPEGDIQTISRLVEISKLDTLYRDIYFYRAYELIDPMLSYSTYARMKESIASLGWVENQLRAALERSDWTKARELTERIRGIKASAAVGDNCVRLGEALYDAAWDIPIDPFSPGLHVFVGGSPQKLYEWQGRAVELLSLLARTDASKKAFYTRRGADFQSLSIKAPAGQQEEKRQTV